MAGLRRFLRGFCCIWKQSGEKHDEKGRAPGRTSDSISTVQSRAEYQNPINPPLRNNLTTTQTHAQNTQDISTHSTRISSTVLDPQRVRKETTIPEGFKQGQQKNDLELWNDLLNHMNTAEWEVMSQDLGYYENSDTLALEIHEEFGLTLVENTKVAQNHRSGSTVCLCTEGVFVFGMQFESCCLISRRIASADQYLQTEGLHPEGQTRSAGRPYFTT